MAEWKDITGQKFGRITAVAYEGNGKWLFKCDCGNEIVASIKNVKRGATKSCGCLKREMQGERVHNFVDMSGLRFNRLTVDKYVGGGKWLCFCECGNKTIASGKNIREGITKSCGCIRTEERKSRKIANPVKDNPHYCRWRSMRARCENKNDPHYKNYGGRGITVCEEWKSFRNFLEWVEASGYEDGLTIDRIDNDKGYCPENCRWVTRTEQQRNKRNNVLIEYKGEKKCLSEWARQLGVCGGSLSKAALGLSAETIEERMDRYENGMKRKKLMITIGGETKPINEWEEISGTPRKIIVHRLERGWTPERAVYQKVRGRGN